MSADKEEMLLRSPNVSVSVLFDTVQISIVCGSDYEAHVLFDDLTERLSAGQKIVLEPGQPKQDGLT